MLCIKWKLSPTLLPGIGFIFITKESVNNGGRSCRKSRISNCLWLTQYCVSAPSYGCPELFYSLTRVFFFFSLSNILCFIVLYWKVQALPILTSHSNHSMKVRCAQHLPPHQHLCHWKDIILMSAFLIKRLANIESRFGILGLTEKVTLLFSSKTS